MLSAASLAAQAFAQAHDGCPEHPASLEAMRNCYRPVLVFSPSGSDPRIRKELAQLDDAADDMMDRNEMLVPIVADGRGYAAPLDAPAAQFSAAQMAALRARFHVSPSQFAVILIGEDGQAKLASGSPIAMERLNRVVDAMPMRQQEMQRRHSN